VTGRLVVVSGTGTGIGKTHLADALVRALTSLVPRVAGIKPIESGVTDPTTTDAARLQRASSFHVKPFGYAFAEGVAPHLAARRAGHSMDLDGIVASIAAARASVDVLVLELPGGLFSPVTDRLLNAELAQKCAPDSLILVVSDRLGALHDATACLRAASTLPIDVAEVVFVEPPLRDASTGDNAEEFQRISQGPHVSTLPRAEAAALARTRPVLDLASRALARQRSRAV
jgi:dethiobiotin synthetase